MIDRLVFGLGSAHHVSKKRSFELLDLCYLNGVRHFDTSYMYGFGYGNYVLNEWLDSRSIIDVTIILKNGIGHWPINNVESRMLCISLVAVKRLGLVNEINSFSVKKPALKFNGNNLIKLIHEPRRHNVRLITQDFDGVAGHDLCGQKYNGFVQGSIFESCSKDFNSVFGGLRFCDFKIEKFHSLVKSDDRLYLFTTTKLENLKALIS